jgi:hypothetical protein
MVEHIRTVMSRDEDVGNYKPLALLAVVAFGVSALFSALSVILTIVALATRRQLLEPWLIPMAFLGVLLSIAARWQISLSEGTREGRRLTNIAWWLSMIGGCIYAAYYAGNVMALHSQSREFIKDQWVELLRQGKWEQAYLLTLAPDQRKGVSAADVFKRFGDKDAFRDEPLPRLLERTKDHNNIEILSAPEWREIPQGMDVTANLRIETPLGDYLAVIPALGVLSKDRGSREWFILRPNIAVQPMSYSDYGWMCRYLEEEANAFITGWQTQFRGYQLTQMYFDTLPISGKQRIGKGWVFITQSVLAPAIGDLMTYPFGVHTPFVIASRLRHPDATARMFFPETVNFGRALVKFDEKKIKGDDAVKEQLAAVILNGESIRRQPAQPGTDVRLEVLPDPAPHVRASMAVDIILPVSKEACHGRIYADCDDPKLLDEMMKRKDVIASKGDEAKVKDLLSSLPHTWRISEISVDFTPVTPPGPPK